mgnify:CR=1 FL=1
MSYKRKEIRTPTESIPNLFVVQKNIKNLWIKNIMKCLLKLHELLGFWELFGKPKTEDSSQVGDVLSLQSKIIPWKKASKMLLTNHLSSLCKFLTSQTWQRTFPAFFNIEASVSTNSFVCVFLKIKFQIVGYQNENSIPPKKKKHDSSEYNAQFDRFKLY